MKVALLFSYIPLAILQLSPSTAASQTPLTTATKPPPIVNIRNGTLAGKHNPFYNQDFFLGIPFAAPPISNLRLRRPVPPPPWPNFTRLADSYGPYCMGNALHVPGIYQPDTAPMSEDCLHLNIIRPASPPPEPKLPVMVWIHGGGFQHGSAVDARYNGSFLVAQSVAVGTPIIFVSVNYRLGLFGMMNAAGVEENLLLRDQRQALAWVQENIGAFGGDPGRVTIAGESAGAASVGYHLMARDEGLFSGAIAQSGGPFSTAPFLSEEEKGVQFESVLNVTGCAGVECLRSVPAEVLNKASLAVPYSHTFALDGDLVTDTSYNLLRAGKFVKVPLLIGTNRNEATSVVQYAMPGPLNTHEDFAGIIAASNSGKLPPVAMVERWAALYQDEIDAPSAAGLGTVRPDPGPALGAEYGKTALFLGDAFFHAGRRFAARVWAESGVACYSYFFDVVTANVDKETLGATHFQEIPFVFGDKNGDGWEVDPFPEEEGPRRKFEELAGVMSGMWISFVVSGSPNNHHQESVGNITWPMYTREKPENMVFSAVDGLGLRPDTWREEAIQMFFDLADMNSRHP
ncbi:Lipase 2 [Colletotrichum gloeosporioides]|uniref:Carboxylic ester hydrolase n=1 Tax=Colletotrichum gloeosporioides TaxID=474922 RepID=A0A8H4CMY2_COLGL|nr:Lipase 2 [Colletotrichum gloeosporioides]KAF3806622.1 Lipase 2 [Colletotrichum gloeosporioides]